VNRHSRDLFGFSNANSDQLVGNSDQLVGNRDHVVALQEGIRKVIKECWPRKPAYHLALALDVTVRQAERILSGKQGVSLIGFQRLMRDSAYGERFFDLFVEGGKAQWIAEVRQERKITDIKRKRRALEQELKALGGEQ
jgi:hypothetical protein